MQWTLNEYHVFLPNPMDLDLDLDLDKNFV
jgi:hypothetical protein